MIIFHQILLLNLSQIFTNLFVEPELLSYFLYWNRMKLLQNTILESLSSAISTQGPNIAINGSLDSYSCKMTGSDKKLYKYLNTHGHSPSELKALSPSESQQQLIYMVSHLILYMLLVISWSVLRWLFRNLCLSSAERCCSPCYLHSMLHFLTMISVRPNLRNSVGNQAFPSLSIMWTQICRHHWGKICWVESAFMESNWWWDIHTGMSDL